MLLADAGGKLARVLVGVDPAEPLAALAALPIALPEGTYHLAEEGVTLDARLAALGWALGGYQFTRYRKARRAPATLAVPAEDLQALAPLVEATALVRDLVNTPTEDMGPEQLGDAVHKLGKAHKAKVRDWVGNELLKHNFPTIHAVGRASHRAPRLIELSWGKSSHPKLVIVGKGVCFDTGGLNLKGGDGMRWMKKDMGGAAHAIALASLVMQAKLPVRLTLLVPAVENMPDGDSYRPSDVLTSLSGLTIEVLNTDAEGRLILCDALTWTVQTYQPQAIVDAATLTGACVIALGKHATGLMSKHDDLAAELLAAGDSTLDRAWRLPLWDDYQTQLESGFADVANIGGKSAGAITAGCFLSRFTEGQRWAHLDIAGTAWDEGRKGMATGRPVPLLAQWLLDRSEK
ncbi:MAG: leucyl aminopeptidase [Lysobacterales bacterium 13-68-4]|nr:MAG: leucyl aminopeptidase [Xanthomonadales bacterium 13-68-4]